jgi:hypothetical protein
MPKNPEWDGYHLTTSVVHLWKPMPGKSWRHPNFARRGGDTCGGVSEIVLDHFDPQAAHEDPYFVAMDPHPVCRGGNYFDVPGHARCAVRLGLHGPNYSDSRDGFRICLGPVIALK